MNIRQGSLCDSCDRPKNHPSSSLQSLRRHIQRNQLTEVQFDSIMINGLALWTIAQVESWTVWTEMDL